MIKQKQRNWHILHDFERRQKELFLKKLTKNESLRILSGLYEFAQEIGVRTDYKRLDLRKIRALSKIHSYFQKLIYESLGISIETVGQIT